MSNEPYEDYQIAISKCNEIQATLINAIDEIATGRAKLVIAELEIKRLRLRIQQLEAEQKPVDKSDDEEFNKILRERQLYRNIIYAIDDAHTLGTDPDMAFERTCNIISKLADDGSI